MNKFTKWLSSTFPYPFGREIPPPPPSDVGLKIEEPSFFTKGIARVWVEDRKGWKTKRVRAQNQGLSLVRLTHSRLGVEIRLSECDDGTISDIGTYVMGEKVTEAFNPGSLKGWASYDHIHSAILSNPYPALKKILERQRIKKTELERRLKEIAELGLATVAQKSKITTK